MDTVVYVEEQKMPRLDCTDVHADLGLHCLLTESVDTIVYVEEQKMSRLDCTDVHADLDLHCPQNAWPFWCIVHHVLCYSLEMSVMHF